MDPTSPTSPDDLAKLYRESDTFRKAYQTCPAVKDRMTRGGSLVEVIRDLVELLDSAHKANEILRQIAPKAVRFKGRRFVWHCPNDMIPTQDLDG